MSPQNVKKLPRRCFELIKSVEISLLMIKKGEKKGSGINGDKHYAI